MKAARIIVAFLVSAIAAALAPFAVACTGAFVFTGKCDVDFSWSPFALAIAFAATIFIAVPLFFLFWRLGWLRWWQVCFGGAVVGLLSPIILQIIDSESNWVWYQFAILSVPLGIVSSLVFWFIGVRKNEQNE